MALPGASILRRRCGLSMRSVVQMLQRHNWKVTADFGRCLAPEDGSLQHIGLVHRSGWRLKLLLSRDSRRDLRRPDSPRKNGGRSGGATVSWPGRGSSLGLRLPARCDGCGLAATCWKTVAAAGRGHLPVSSPVPRKSLPTFSGILRCSAPLTVDTVETAPRPAPHT
jgi:hypothetical protein